MLRETADNALAEKLIAEIKADENAAEDLFENSSLSIIKFALNIINTHPPIDREMKETFLRLAAKTGCCDVITYLIEEAEEVRVNVNASPKSQYTALSWAIERNQTEVVKLLLTKGADIDIVNYDGLSPIMITEKHIMMNHNRKEIKKILKKHGGYKLNKEHEQLFKELHLEVEQIIKIQAAGVIVRAKYNGDDPEIKKIAGDNNAVIVKLPGQDEQKIAELLSGCVLIRFPDFTKEKVNELTKPSGQGYCYVQSGDKLFYVMKSKDYDTCIEYNINQKSFDEKFKDKIMLTEGDLSYIKSITGNRHITPNNQFIEIFKNEYQIAQFLQGKENQHTELLRPKYLPISCQVQGKIIELILSQCFFSDTAKTQTKDLDTHLSELGELHAGRSIKQIIPPDFDGLFMDLHDLVLQELNDGVLHADIACRNVVIDRLARGRIKLKDIDNGLSLLMNSKGHASNDPNFYFVPRSHYDYNALYRDTSGRYFKPNKKTIHTDFFSLKMTMIEALATYLGFDIKSIQRYEDDNKSLRVFLNQIIKHLNTVNDTFKVDDPRREIVKQVIAKWENYLCTSSRDLSCGLRSMSTPSHGSASALTTTADNLPLSISSSDFTAEPSSEYNLVDRTRSGLENSDENVGFISGGYDDNVSALTKSANNLRLSISSSDFISEPSSETNLADSTRSELENTDENVGFIRGGYGSTYALTTSTYNLRLSISSSDLISESSSESDLADSTRFELENSDEENSDEDVKIIPDEVDEPDVKSVIEADTQFFLKCFNTTITTTNYYNNSSTSPTLFSSSSASKSSKPVESTIEKAADHSLQGDTSSKLTRN